MDSKVFTTIAVTGFTVAFFHAAIPTHWLPFVLTARVQGWSKARTLAIVVIGGLISSMFLKLVLLPVLYEWAERKFRQPSSETAKPDQ